jgi:hypothetical protein
MKIGCLSLDEQTKESIHLVPGGARSSRCGERRNPRGMRGRLGGSDHCRGSQIVGDMIETDRRCRRRWPLRGWRRRGVCGGGSSGSSGGTTGRTGGGRALER